MIMQIRLNRFVASGMLFLILGGCSVFMPVQVPTINTYQINMLNESSIECKNNVSLPDLQVTRMKANEPYDSTNMFYSEVKYQLNHYSRNQWAAAPSEMITKTMEEKLLQSCNYDNVVSADFMTAAKYRLNSQLLELKQNIYVNDSEIKLAVLVQLVNNNTNQVIKSKTFVERVKVTSNPEGYVSGTNVAVNKFISDLVSWLK